MFPELRMNAKNTMEAFSLKQEWRRSTIIYMIGTGPQPNFSYFPIYQGGQRIYSHRLNNNTCTEISKVIIKTN